MKDIALAYLTGVQFLVQKAHKVCYTRGVFLQKIISLLTKGQLRLPLSFFISCDIVGISLTVTSSY